MKPFLYWLIISIASIAILGTFGLVMNEWNDGDICPKIASVPACYIVFACFVLALLGHLISVKAGHVTYFTSVCFVTLIAATGTVGEIIGTVECPKTAGGIPMCFISLGICLSLLILKFLYLNSKTVL